LCLGMMIVAAYAIRDLSRISRIPLWTILAHVRPLAIAGVLMTLGVYLLERYVVHAQGAHGLASSGSACSWSTYSRWQRFISDCFPYFPDSRSPS
jgi:hypothetical protein